MPWLPQGKLFCEHYAWRPHRVRAKGLLEVIICYLAHGITYQVGSFSATTRL